MQKVLCTLTPLHCTADESFEATTFDMRSAINNSSATRSTSLAVQKTHNHVSSSPPSPAPATSGTPSVHGMKKTREKKSWNNQILKINPDKHDEHKARKWEKVVKLACVFFLTLKSHWKIHKTDQGNAVRPLFWSGRCRKVLLRKFRLEDGESGAKKLVFHKTSDKRLSSSFILVSSSKGLFLGLHKRREKFGVRAPCWVWKRNEEQKINKQSKYWKF